MKGEGLDGNGTCYLYEFDKNKLQDLNFKECMAYEQKFKSSILHSQLYIISDIANCRPGVAELIKVYMNKYEFAQMFHDSMCADLDEL